jgi:hypothetical protein
MDSDPFEDNIQIGYFFGKGYNWVNALDIVLTYEYIGRSLGKDIFLGIGVLKEVVNNACGHLRNR